MAPCGFNGTLRLDWWAGMVHNDCICWKLTDAFKPGHQGQAMCKILSRAGIYGSALCTGPQNK